MNYSDLAKTFCAFLLLAGCSAHAGSPGTIAPPGKVLTGSGSGVGPSADLCKNAKFRCASKDGNTGVCIFPDYKALVVLALTGGSTFTKTYEAQGVSIVGGISTLEYSDLTLKICEGLDPTDNLLGYLTYDPVKYSNLPMHCSQNGD